MLAGARFGLNPTAPEAHLLSFLCLSSHSPCSCRFSYPLKKNCKCPSLASHHPRQQKPRQTSFLSLASLSKGSMMYSLHLWVYAVLIFSAPLTTSQKAKPEDPHCMVQGIPASHLWCSPCIDCSPNWLQRQQGKVGGPVSHLFSVSFFPYTNPPPFFSASPQVHVVTIIFHRQMGRNPSTSSHISAVRCYLMLPFPTIIQHCMLFPQKPQEIIELKRK